MPTPWTALHTLRDRSGLSQTELAKRARISRQHLNRIELGHVSPRPYIVARLAAALDVPVTALTNGGVVDDKGGQRGSEKADVPS